MPGPFAQRALFDKIVDDEGGWAEVQFPKVISDPTGRYTYVGTVAGTDGDVVVIPIDGATDEVDTFVLHAALGGEGTADMHDNPSLVILPNGKLACYYTRHADSTIRYRVSTNTVASDPMLSGGFASEATIAVPNTHKYDYPSVAYIGSTLYLFIRDIPTGGTDAHLKYVTSSNGTTWGTTPTDIYNNPTKTAYWSLAVDPDHTRVHVLTFDDNEDAVTNNLLKHFTFDGTHAYQSDGDLISASFPLAPSDIDTIASTGGHHLHCLEVGDDGRVGFVAARRVSGVHGVIRGILASGSWTVESLGVVSTPNYAWGTVIDPFDFDHCLLSLWSDASTVETWDYSKATGSWVGVNLGLPGKSNWPIFNRSRAQGLVAVVLAGDGYVTYTNYQFDVYLIRRAA